MIGSEDLSICVACGTQIDVPLQEAPKACRICDDPRQFVPAQGQTWTSLGQMRGNYSNNFQQDSVEERMWSIWTTPKFAIGQRCVLLQTSNGNVLWDLITYLDDETVDFIKGKGGLKAIVISHPHYYTTHLDWAEAFNCPVYVAVEDQEWVSQKDAKNRRKLIKDQKQEIVPDVTAVKLGGHFPGSLVISWEEKLFIADTFVTTPSAYYHIDRPPGTTSYAFMWSIPNIIPLPPSELLKMWRGLKDVEFESTHAAFVGTDIRDKKVKSRVLESMKIQTRAVGYHDHDILKESWH